MKIPFMFVRIFRIALMALGGRAATLAGGPEPFPLIDGERILIIGNGLVENDQWHALFETRLQRRHPKRSLAFRYMGWSGDTVRASARTAGFQVPQGLARLEKEAIALKPTVVFLAYGMNESFDGPDKLDDFLRDYDTLLKTLEPLKARLVIVSPTFHEDLGRPFPDPTEHNRKLDAPTLARYLLDSSPLPWKPIYAKVSGDLPLEETRSRADQQLTYVRCEIDVITPGNFVFQVNDAEGLTLWVDGKAAAIQSKTSLELPRGTHTFVFIVDLRERKSSHLRWELAEVKGFKGQAKFIDGHP